MGAQHSTVGRTKSLDESVHQQYQQNNGQGTRRASITQQSSDQLRSKDADFNRIDREGKSKSTLVIVHRPSSLDPSTGHGRVEDDPLFKKLDELPMFVPLMHEVETGSKLFGARNRALQQIRSKIQPTPFIHIVRLYEDRLRRHADSLNVEQGRLSKCVREVDMEVSGIFKTLTERQKKFAKHAENLGKMHDLTHTLLKCQTALKECERNLNILNGFLPGSDRLEPFSWEEMFTESTEDNGVVGKGQNVSTVKSDAHQVKLSTSDFPVGSVQIAPDGRKSNLESDESVEVALEQGES